MAGKGRHWRGSREKCLPGIANCQNKKREQPEKLKIKAGWGWYPSEDGWSGKLGLTVPESNTHMMGLVIVVSWVKLANELKVRVQET